MNRLQEATEFPGFYEISGFSRYVVNQTGVVVNKQTHEVLSGSTNPDGYHNYRLGGDNGHTLTWGRHRLLGFVFKHPGVDIEPLTVNHENGIKGDDRLENLEWKTYQGNAEHAGEFGLTDKCTPISVRDVDTGEIQQFPSIVECARVFDVSKDTINYRVKIGDSRVFPERKQYRVSTITRPWYIPSDVERELKVNSTSKSILMRVVPTGEVMEFNQLTQLAKHLKMPVPTLSVWMTLPDQPVLPGFIQLKWVTDTTPWRETGDPYMELSRTTGKKPVRVTRPETGESMVFTSAVECATVRGLKPSALNYRLKSAGTVTYLDGCRYEYYSSSSGNGLSKL